MKIAIDVREATGMQTGKGYYTLNLVRELLKLDNENDYYLYTDSATDAFSGFDNVVYTSINKKGFLWHFSAMRNMYKKGIDILFAPTSYIIPALHKPKKLKVVMTIHDLVAFLFPEHHNRKAVFIEKITLKRALKRVAKVVSVSKNTKNDLLERYPQKIEEADIAVIPNAASESFRQIKREDLAEFAKNNNVPEKFIFAAATLEPRKNFSFLIRAYAKLRETSGDHKLLIAGKKGWHYDEIFKTVDNMGLQNHVQFLGYLSEEDLAKYYNLATLFVYPSLYEGFGLQPLEAMQCGCPVVTSHISSLPEVVGNSAVLINPHDEENLAKEMDKLLNNDVKRKDLINRGLVQSKRFSWEASAKSLLDLFNHI